MLWGYVIPSNQDVVCNVYSCFLFHVIRVEYGDGLAINPDGALLLEFGEAAEERELLDTEDIRHFLAADIQ